MQCFKQLLVVTGDVPVIKQSNGCKTNFSVLKLLNYKYIMAQVMEW
jgi:hypothetical protein